MASETFFYNGDRVKFVKGWWNRRKHEKALMKLRGTVVGCNDSARECVFYYVEWEADDADLEAIGVDPDDSWQSDALVKVRKKSK